MKKLLIVAITLLACSCTKNSNKPSYNDIYPIIGKVEDENGSITNIRLYVIDSCEYIGHVFGYPGDYLAHKGNCKNRIHYQKDNK